MSFPVDAVLGDIGVALDAQGVVVVEAPPGTGKTTRVPLFLANRALERGTSGQVWVLEPRRIAARASAAFVARSIGEALGESVGYAVRFDRKESAATRVMYVTEALLGRRFISDATLSAGQGIHTVILDEFHERSVHTDLALARTLALMRLRPDLRLVVMSATLDGAALGRALGAPVVRAEVRRFPVELRPFTRKDERPLPEQVRTAVSAARAVLARMHEEGTTGTQQRDVLVFLPGVGEIERCIDALAAEAKRDGVLLLPLHGDLDAAAQDAVLKAGSSPRVILATNVAETSITVEGVGAVVDSGLARVAGHDPWSGVPTLSLQGISRSSADQRAGRAGRLGPGVCFRLFHDYDQRPAALAPELQRMDLSAVALETWGEVLPWLDAPPVVGWKAAVELLVRLGAVDTTSGERTAIGDGMLGMPLAPRLARVLVEGAALGVGEAAAAMVAALGERSRVAEDLVSRVLDGARLGGQAEQERKQLAQLLRGLDRNRAPQDVGRALALALLAGFPDRVGQRRGARIVFAEGGSAVVDAATAGGDGFVVVPDVERGGLRPGDASANRVRRLTRIPDDWLLDRAELKTAMRWTGTRVEVTEQLRYGDLVLDEGAGTGDPEAVGRVLAAEVEAVAHKVFPDWDAARALVQRVDWLRRVGVDLPALALDDVVRGACVGKRSFSELTEVSLVQSIGAVLDLALIDRLAPVAIPLGNRKRTPITYPPEQEPYLASKMQDFFGLEKSPLLAGSRPLVLHLLAPNQRPVQITSDLGGFWKNHWPAIRKELMRRYPRQMWPENPLEAEPPEFRERRR